jgi:hypothetical protein
VVEWLAFGQCGNNNNHKGDDQKDAYATQTPLVAFFPEAFGQALEELGYGDLGHPDEHGVEYPSCEHTSRSNFAAVDFFRVRQTDGVDVVCAIYEHNMDAAHARKEWDDAPSHDLVFREQAVIPHEATR